MEDVRIADRALHPELAGLTRDFWLLDAGTANAVAILLRYGPEGRTEGTEISRDSQVLTRCERQRDVAFVLIETMGSSMTLSDRDEVGRCRTASPNCGMPH